MIKLDEEQIIKIAAMLLYASSILLAFTKKGFEVHVKSDGTRVCDADIAVNRYICDFLQQEYPKANIISEEGDLPPNPKFLARKKLCFCVDPLDGTEAYIQNKDEYSISLGVITQGIAEYGWIAVPVEGAVYYCDQQSIYRLGSDGISEVTREDLADKYIMPKDSSYQIASELHENFIFQSSALKFVTLAKGLGHALVQTHSTKIWDVAGGFAMLNTLGYKPLSSKTHAEILLNSIEIPPFFVNVEG